MRIWIRSYIGEGAGFVSRSVRVVSTTSFNRISAVAVPAQSLPWPPPAPLRSPMCLPHPLHVHHPSPPLPPVSLQAPAARSSCTARPSTLILETKLGTKASSWASAQRRQAAPSLLSLSSSFMHRHPPCPCRVPLRGRPGLHALLRRVRRPDRRPRCPHGRQPREAQQQQQRGVRGGGGRDHPPRQRRAEGRGWSPVCALCRAAVRVTQGRTAGGHCSCYHDTHPHMHTCARAQL